MAKQVFSIVVADDEQELREAICSLIDWEALGFRLVGSAGNGLDALELVERLQPDLLLTDIRMPFISGTELARQVRELQPLIQVAFLSGYDDFEYAQSGIDSRVIAYLLKPISNAELTNALREIHRKMAAAYQALMPEAESGNLPAAVASLLLDPFSDFPGERETWQQLADCGMIFTEPYTLTVLSVSAKGTPVMPQRAAQMADRVLRRVYASGSCVSGGRILSLLAAEDGLQRLGPLLDEYYSIAKRFFGEEVSVGVSRPFSSLARCSAACQEAVEAVRIASAPGLHRIRRIEAETGEQLRSQQLMIEQLDRLLVSGSRTELETALAQLLAERGDELMALQILMTAQGILRASLGDEAVSRLLERHQLSDPLSSGLTPEALSRKLVSFCCGGQELLSERRSDGMRLLVERTLRIIAEQYADETLSLQSVGKQLHVSPNYLSANMRKYAGDTFMNLLIRQRMEAARTLIAAGGMKIGEISERCGYTDQHYFSYCFKKYFGVSPAKMRRGEEADG